MTTNPIRFIIPGLEIAVASTALTTEEYTAPTVIEAVAVAATMPLAVAKSIFGFITDKPAPVLGEILSTVTYSTFPLKTGATTSTGRVFPTILPMDFSANLPDKQRLTIYTSSTATTNNDVASDYARYAFVSLMYLDTEISAAKDLTPAKTPDNRLFTAEPTGILNLVPFKGVINDSIATSFEDKLLSADNTIVTSGTNLGLGAADYSNNDHPAVRIIKEMYDKDLSRLSTQNTEIDLPTLTTPLKTGFKAYSLPLIAGDVLDIAIIVSNAQKKIDGTSVIPSRQYRVNITLV